MGHWGGGRQAGQAGGQLHQRLGVVQYAMFAAKLDTGHQTDMLQVWNGHGCLDDNIFNYAQNYRK